MPETLQMSFSQKTFDKAICDIVAGIQPGQVMSYGQVARAAGFPRHARMVSKALRRSQARLPWHRVVKADRTLAFEHGSEAYRQQKDLLANDGVAMSNGKVLSRASDETVDLDKLLWGSPP
jgi:methylated-DNA-protein-cysteine methyltransferase-like protein